MNNRNHKYERESNDVEYCSKCNIGFYYLLEKARAIEVYKNTEELYGEYVNRVNPCLTDEEYIIKKALE
jgi:hypothetical protein